MPPADDGWGKIGVLMVLLALAFAGGVAYFIATSESSEAETAEAEGAADDTGGAADETGGADEDQSDDESETADSAGTEEDRDPDGAEEPDTEVAADLMALGIDGGAIAEPAKLMDAGPDPLRANGELDRPTGLVSMSIESEPAGAQVIRKSDGVRLGVTPYRYEVEASGGKVTFVLKLEGHKSMSVPMPADRDSVRQVMLFPGKGGEVVPAPPVTNETDEVQPEKASEPTADTKVAELPKPSAANKKPPAKQIKPKKPRVKTSRAKKPKKPKKPKSAGTVDYVPDQIPLD